MGAGSPKNSDKKVPSNKPTRSMAILLLATAADTTWRMFFPVLGGMAAGMWLDAQIGTKPWSMIVGLTIGTVVTAFLVKQQYKKADK